MNDALGNEIIIGNYYGYSTNKNGFSHVIIGIAISCKKQVRLDVVYKKSALHDNPMILKENEKLNNVSIRSEMLFPVQKENINI